MPINKAQSVVQFYVLCNHLKNLIRRGWKVWNVKRERIESVAEHIFGVQSLAIAIWSQYNYNIDIKKVILMLALHEMEEISIGDMIFCDIKKQDKQTKGHQAIKIVLQDLIKKDEIESLILEFDERKTPEAKFAYCCDKLECDLQCKLYDEEKCVDLTKQENNPAIQDKTVSTLLQQNYSWSEMWLEFGRRKYPYDKNFRAISKYAEKQKLLTNLAKTNKTNQK